MLTCLVPLIIIMLAFVLIKRNGGLDRRVKILYLIIFWLEIPGAAIRTAISGLVLLVLLTPLWMMFAIVTLLGSVAAYVADKNPWSTGTTLGSVLLVIGAIIVVIGSLIAGWGPNLWSLATMLGLRGGAKETRWELDARVMSKTREEVRHCQALSHIQTLAKITLKAPVAVFAIDSLLPRAFTIGSTLFLTKGLLKSNDLMALTCRELYYLQSGDARLVLALRRLVIPPFYALSRFAGHLAPGNLAFSVIEAANERYIALVVYLSTFFGALAGGGFGILVMNPFIVRYFLGAMTRANIFATQIGLGNPLADYYDTYEYFDFAIPYIYRPKVSGELLRDDIIRWQRGERWAI
jgi:hypothetical protein